MTLPFWWLSFCDEKKNLGACVVQAHDQAEAVLVAHRLKINPGGSVAVVGPCRVMPAGTRVEPNRLYQTAELLAMGEPLINSRGEDVK